MLRRDDDAKQPTFADQTHAAQSVPEDHDLMRMKRAVDWNAVEDELAAYYPSDEGRPSLPPAVLVRMLVLEQYADLSDRDVYQEVGYNLLYRAFVGVPMDKPVPDDTTLVKFRARIGEEGARKVFALLNEGWEAAGLISGKRRVLDGVHLWAKVARRSWLSLMREGRRVVVEAVAAVDAPRAERLRAELVGPACDERERTQEALRVERERTEKLLAAVSDIKDERVEDRARLLGAMLQEKDWPVSFDDPDARWGHKGPSKPFLGYKAHESLDPDSRMITGVDVVPGNANEAVRTDELLEQEPTKREDGAAIIADKLYNNATTVGQVKAVKGRACFSGSSQEAISDDFTYDGAADTLTCREGKSSIGKVRSKQGDLYYFSTRDCGGCPKRAECLTPAEREGRAGKRRRVYLSDVRKERIVAGKEGRAWRKEQLRVRYRIEAKFDEQMNRHGLRHARYWGLAKVTMQVLFNAITVNMKRAAKLLREQAAGPPMVAAAPA